MNEIILDQDIPAQIVQFERHEVPSGRNSDGDTEAFQDENCPAYRRGDLTIWEEPYNPALHMVYTYFGNGDVLTDGSAYIYDNGQLVAVIELTPDEEGRLFFIGQAGEFKEGDEVLAYGAQNCKLYLPFISRTGILATSYNPRYDQMVSAHRKQQSMKRREQLFGNL